ncbi:MAG TPA: carbamoyltransferase C-terminal domain-containing protein [Nitrospira sp.]|jgi:carbamoyltransferase|nr:carbamoyltransferase C-terminal domain-containing protein [Nitrospira sp.]
MYTLGINAAFHDPAACLVRDGKLVAAAEEERFTRIKHGKRPIPFSTYELPFHAIDFCVRQAGIKLTNVDHVAYSFDPYLLLSDRVDDAQIPIPLHSRGLETSEWESPWDPLSLSAIVNAPRHLASGVPHHLQEYCHGLADAGPEHWHYVPHHLAHAASAFHASPYQEAAVMTLDGRGERATTSYYVGRGQQLLEHGAVTMPHSLGLLYEQITSYLGYLHSSDEYKVMALASFGKPEYVDHLRKLVRVESEGRYVIAPLKLADWFGPPRVRGGPLEQRHYNLARSVQQVLEETTIELVNWLHESTRQRALCLAGGVALNCVLNARVRSQGPFNDVWVQPAAGDAGTALGAALWIDAQLSPASGIRSSTMEHVFWGPAYGDGEIEALLRRAKLSYRRLMDVAEETAALLERDRIIGWFQGAMEFGPRALGARSILASPINASMQDRLNDIKDREDFRPVAPVVLEEDAGEWFVDAQVSPFMLFVFDVRSEKAGRIPAVRHVDGTARVQTINRAQHPLYYDLLRAFKRRTGVPVLVNTSFNVRGEPIVCTPRDAVSAFFASPLDALVIGSFLVEK